MLKGETHGVVALPSTDRNTEKIWLVQTCNWGTEDILGLKSILVEADAALLRSRQVAQGRNLVGEKDPAAGQGIYLLVIPRDL